MTDNEVRDVIRDVLAGIAPEADLDSLPGEADLRRELDLDSLDFLTFVVGVDERLGVRVPEDDYPKLTTLEGCLTYLRARV